MTEDRLALRLHHIRQQAEQAIRRGEQLDPRTVLAMTRGEARG